nr:MAG TPA: hypothetical protein [Caudoviricetes sp.]
MELIRSITIILNFAMGCLYVCVSRENVKKKGYSNFFLLLAIFSILNCALIWR